MENIICEELSIDSEKVFLINDKSKINLLKLDLSMIIMRIDNQIEEYKVKWEEEGISGDYDWFKKAKYKVKLYRLLSQQMLLRVGEINDILKEEERKSLKNLFITNARKELEEEVYDRIMTRTLLEIGEL